MAFAKLHGLDVDFRIFPDLRIDKAGKGQSKQPLREAGLRERIVLVNGFSDVLAALKNQFVGNIGHRMRFPVCNAQAGNAEA
ncbi:hypothetical protein [Mesorhizobium sp. Root157]|uniref:hypothetical protein n=1 Tax=Mesorhizobium sp. Root157 TaxID=1736477 RepID=UPI001FCD0311|nr:hypothetical protein [Mesorhizobium sp. Root157]